MTQYFCNNVSMIELFKRFSLSFFYLYLYIIQFTIGNEITGVAADLVDKPWRPIPSKRITIARAWFLYYMMVVVFLIYSYLIGHLFAAVTWVLLAAILNFTAVHESSITKNGILVPGTYVMISVVWCLMNNTTNVYDHPTVFWNLIFNSCIIGAIIVQQDMRDVEGDRALGRKTFSVLMGTSAAAQLIAKICFIALLCVLLEGYFVEQLRLVSKTTYMLVMIVLYGIMIVRNWYLFDVRKNYEYYFQMALFAHFLMMPVIKID